MRFKKRFRPDRDKTAQVIEEISSIPHSCDAAGWTPVPYTIPEEFALFEKNIAVYLEQYICLAHPDMYNVNYFNEPSYSEEDIAICEIDPQRIKHKKGIRNIRNYQELNLSANEHCQARLKKALADIEKELGQDEK